MNCLVTGGAGFVGTNLIKKLLKEGHEVVSLDNYSSGLKENEQEYCKYIDIDLCDVKDYSDYVGKPDVIFHMAALARIQTSLRAPRHHIINNFESTLNILDWSKEQGGIPIVYAGSSSKHHGVTNSPYSWVKWSGEELCKLYSDVYGLNTTICRFYNVYGKHHLRIGDYATVVGIFEEQYHNAKDLTITSDGEQRRDFTHVDDVVDGMIRVMRAMFGEVDMFYHGTEFELGRGKNYSINEIAEMFGGKRNYIDSIKGEVRDTLCTDELTKEMLEWKPKRNVEDWIRNEI